MGIESTGQICVMIHSGSRGFGHQVATDALLEMERAMARDKLRVNDRQLACARITSKEGDDYLKVRVFITQPSLIIRLSRFHTLLAPRATRSIHSHNDHSS